MLVCAAVTTPDQTPNAPAEAAPRAPVEMVRKVYAKDVRDKDRLHTVFRVARKAKHVARSGKAFLIVGLEDKTGELDARVFDNVDAADALFAPGDYLLVEGGVISFHGKPQVVIERAEKLDPEPLDPAEFTPAHPEEPRGPGGSAPGQLRELAERIGDPNLRQLVLSFLDEPEIAEGLRTAPAAKGVHHAYKGGLAEHILSVAKLVNRLVDHYPAADRDLAVAGALLHDISKIGELGRDKNWEYTDEGRLVGHLVMAAQRIHEKTSRIPGFPPLLSQHLTHIVLSHHGTPEWGSERLPLTLEAFLVHMADTIDSRMASFLEAMQRDQSGNEHWTELLRLHDRPMWKGPLPTARGKAPVEGRRREKERDREKDKERERKRAKPAEAKPEPAPKLAFKPLSELAPSPEAEQAAEQPKPPEPAPAEAVPPQGAPPQGAPPEPPEGEPKAG